MAPLKNSLLVVAKSQPMKGSRQRAHHDRRVVKLQLLCECVHRFRKALKAGIGSTILPNDPTVALVNKFVIHGESLQQLQRIRIAM
ncbi:hypothetical protein CKO22_18400 [Thiococcus pfennigii]|nr:hypothetical protein [Thiococcus pfennigii]